jgi:hypothetical protein
MRIGMRQKKRVEIDLHASCRLVMDMVACPYYPFMEMYVVDRSTTSLRKNQSVRETYSNLLHIYIYIYIYIYIDDMVVMIIIC